MAPMKPSWVVLKVSNVIPPLGWLIQADEVRLTSRTSELGSSAVLIMTGSSCLITIAWARWLIAKWVSKPSSLRIGGAYITPALHLVIVSWSYSKYWVFRTLKYQVDHVWSRRMLSWQLLEMSCPSLWMSCQLQGSRREFLQWETSLQPHFDQWSRCGRDYAWRAQQL